MKHFRGKKLHLLDIQMYILTFPFFNNLITSTLINALPLMQISLFYTIKSK